MDILNDNTSSSIMYNRFMCFRLKEVLDKKNMNYKLVEFVRRNVEFQFKRSFKRSKMIILKQVYSYFVYEYI